MSQEKDQAQSVLESAVQNQPPKRGCQRGCQGCLIAVAILAVPLVWFNIPTPLRVSKETTYVLGPMTADGKRIDYFRAMEERLYPPEMKTDDNGYRLIVRATGDRERSTGCCEDKKLLDPEPYRSQVYAKLGLDPNEKPTLKAIESPDANAYLYKYDQENPPAEGEESQQRKFGSTMTWTFDDFPILKDWLDENTAGIDLLGEAVRKPAFFIPRVRKHENDPIFESWGFEEAVMMREWARAVSARARYRIGIGDIDGAIYDVMTIRHLGRHAGKQGTLIMGFVGMAIEGMGVATGVGGNSEYPPTKEQIERLVREIDALPPRATLNEVFESERYFGLASTQDMYWGNSPGFFDEDPFPYFRLLLPGMTWSIDINIALTRLNNVYDTLLMSDDKTLHDVLAPSGNPYNPFPLLFIRSRTNRLSDTLIQLLRPSVHNAKTWRERIECLENMQRLTLALLLYEKEHGSLPEGDWREALLETADGRRQTAAEFRCPSHPGLADDETTYAMVGNVPNVTPSPNQILLVEIREPQKLGEGDGRISFEQATFKTGLGSHHVGGINVGFRSGAVRFIVENIDSEKLKKLLDGTGTEFQ